MSFRPPTFNLTCHIWRNTGVGGVYAAPDVISQCNLSPGRRVNRTAQIGGGPGAGTDMYMELLLPKLTDVRAAWNGASEDLVEVPAGTHRFYLVQSVDDVGKGFLNEYRLAVMLYNDGGTPFLGGIPAPVPLP